jgi:hypothetical protein
MDNCQHATIATNAAFKAETELVKAESAYESALKVFEIAKSMDAAATLGVGSTFEKVRHALQNGSLGAVLLKELKVANAIRVQTRKNLELSFHVLENAHVVLDRVRARAA